MFDIFKDAEGAVASIKVSALKKKLNGA